MLQKMDEFESKLNLLTQGTEPDEDETVETAILGMIQEPTKLTEFFQALQQGKIY